MFNRVILVDIKNNEIGTEDKLEAHKKGLLHRAFSIFIFNDEDEILLQKRSDSKYHSAGLWSNTCCSHPYIDKSINEYVKLRLVQEMGIKTNLKEVFSFIYKTNFENGLVEYEYDHVFFGEYSKDPVLNPDEACDYKWISIFELKSDIEQNPSSYTAWLKIIFNKHFKYFESYENNNL